MMARASAGASVRRNRMCSLLIKQEDSRALAARRPALRAQGGCSKPNARVPYRSPTVEWALMDEQTARAVEDYDRLLRDEKGHLQEFQANLADRLRAAKLTFGGRLLCPFLRPNF